MKARKMKRRGRTPGLVRKTFDKNQSWGEQFITAKNGNYKNGVVDLMVALAELTAFRKQLADEASRQHGKGRGDLWKYNGAFEDLLRYDNYKLLMKEVIFILCEAVEQRDEGFFKDIAHHMEHAPTVGAFTDPIAKVIIAKGLEKLPPIPTVANIQDILNRDLPKEHRVSDKRTRDDMARAGITKRRPGRPRKTGTS